MERVCTPCGLVLNGAMFLLFSLLTPTESAALQETGEANHVTVSTQFGDVIGLTNQVSETENIDVFFGIPYARPPVGNLRFARPQPVTPWWPGVKNATKYGNVCLQQNPAYWNVPDGKEDCLVLNIYRPRSRAPCGKEDKRELLPIMLYVHGGSFRDQGSILFNYTNLALKGVMVVTINYRLDALGFLSTQDHVIPGNFGLLDAALALEFVKKIAPSFGGNASDVTVFGASAGSALVTQMKLSPLTKGKFQKAILQSGPGTASWSSYKPGTPLNPRLIAFQLGQRLNCSLPPAGADAGEVASLALLSCLRNVTAENLLSEIRYLTVTVYGSNMIFVPVSGDTSGFLPRPPSELAANTSDQVPIPTMMGWSSDDSSWTVQDPEDDGITFEELSSVLGTLVYVSYTSQYQEMLARVLQVYSLTDPSGLSPFELRAMDSKLRTDALMEAFIVKEARQFSKAAEVSGEKTFLFRYDYRPSYKTNPAWQGVTHMDERGMVMGLPNGTRAFSYPDTSENDRTVADLITTMWSNFAKYGDPTPEPLPGGIRWPEFGHTYGDQELLVIRPQPVVEQYDRNPVVELWTGSSGLD